MWPTIAPSTAAVVCCERYPASGTEAKGSAVLREELHHVLEPEPTVPALADAIEGELSAIPEPLHGVDMQMEHVGHLVRRRYRAGWEVA